MQTEVRDLDWVQTSVTNGVARLSLNRPQALNALSLSMIRDITLALVSWRDDPAVTHVLMRGIHKTGPFGAFCAGGDIRYFYQAVQAAKSQAPADVALRESLEDFFTEEYTLNHLIHHYPKPVIAFMDGVVMGGGMGLTQGAGTRIVTERTKMAMPETAIGLFPDVGGGYFLSRCAGSQVGVGEYLALTGQMLTGEQAVLLGLADVCLPSDTLPAIWDKPEVLAQHVHAAHLKQDKQGVESFPHFESILRHFAHPQLPDIVQSLQSDGSEWAQQALQKLNKNSPLMLAVTLVQIQKARGMSLAEDLRMERDMVYHCFAGTPQRHSDTVEGIRALVIDKDHHPRWQPTEVGGVTPQAVVAFFSSPWSRERHPLHAL